MAKSSEQFPQGPKLSQDSAAGELLQKGLEAIKRQAHTEAIATFQELLNATPKPTYRIQAQMGLVRAYIQTGENDKAIALCQSLVKHHNAQVESWAQRALTRLQAMQVTLPASTQQASRTSAVNQTSLQTDRSGFTPLDSKPPVQLTTQAASTSNIDTPTAQPTASKETSSLLPSSSSTETAPQISLFHYQQLNGGQASPTPAFSDFAPLPEVSSTLTDAAAESGVEAQNAPIVEESPLDPAEPTTFRPPRSLNPVKLWGVEAVTALAIFWVTGWLVRRTEGIINWLFQQLHRLIPPIPSIWLDRHYYLPIGILLVGLLIASPWLLDFLMRWFYHQKALSTRQFKLEKPEALRTLRQICLRQGWPLPELRLIPSEAPLCFSYGWLPRNLRLVMSQGLLDQVEEEELASLCAYELGHARNWDLPLMSGLGVVLFLVYQAYWQVSHWGDRQNFPLLRSSAAVLSAILYSIFWLFRKVGLWFSRLRSEYSDRSAVEFTQNPAVYGRSLLKLAQGTAAHIADQGHTPPLLESLDLLFPLSHQLALSPGSCLSDNNLAGVTAWDRQNPYRYWLVWNTPQRLLGERLMMLERCGANFGLSTPTTSSSTQIGRTPTASNYLPTLMLQGAPIFGLILGVAIALFLWFLGGVVNALNWWFFSWLYQDTGVLQASAFLGLGIGLMLKINRLFPDSRSTNTRSNPNLETLLKQPINLPIDSQVVRLEGQLIGRQGIANWLYQDVILKTSTGLVRLHILSSLGPLGNFFSNLSNHRLWQNQAATVTGWARRGATLWLDVEHCQISGKLFPVANLPVWITLLSLAACLWGIRILLRRY